MDIIEAILEHNPRHFIRMNLFGKEYKVCSRCLGTWTLGILSFITFGIMYYLGFRYSFYPIFLLSLVLALVCFADWISAKTPLWNGNNYVRVMTGAMLGISISLWFWFLPLPWIPRILSLLVIEAVFSMIVFLVKYREMKNGLYEIYEEYYIKKFGNKIYCCDCGCCSTACCAGPQLCCIIGLICCCCVCPIMIYMLMKKGG